MTRNLGISLLLFGLLLAGIDGFRVRERQAATPGSATPGGNVHTAEIVGTIPPN